MLILRIFLNQWCPAARDHRARATGPEQKARGRSLFEQSFTRRKKETKNNMNPKGNWVQQVSWGNGRKSGSFFLKIGVWYYYPASTKIGNQYGAVVRTSMRSYERGYRFWVGQVWKLVMKWLWSRNSHDTIVRELSLWNWMTCIFIFQKLELKFFITKR